MKRRAAVLIGIVLLLGVALAGQAPKAQDKETDPQVLQKLQWFQDQKFGLMMHWGPYSQWGVVESWSICAEDEPWCRRSLPDYIEYKRRYEALPKTFNPVEFDPAAWAKAAKAAGMRYVVHTTKHHDGFCMFDTKQTDYRITGPGVPFASNPRANNYWAPEWATPDRHVNYDTAKYPERWKKFKDFTYAQIEELMTGYGPVDILWLDGGWVQPYPAIPAAYKGLIKQPANQDIDMPRIAAMARSHQPGLIVVDRAVGGRYENYRTPEQEIPEKPLPYVWETCMTMGNSWSYVPNDNYKSAGRLIHLLVDIVSKGGNFLLNIGPDAQGRLPAESLKRLAEIGDWMKTNGEAIYKTRPIAPYKEAKTCFTSLADGTVYAVYLADEDEVRPPASIMIYSRQAKPGVRVEMLGVQGALRWEAVGKGMLIHLPPAAVEKPPCRHAWAFKIAAK
ncbi:MAG: alpha-L-fucosidase [Candidatus Aminicenantes bacterium]|nr:alpha-L-fucosidase [Candidatus Aminicenantes bacterium]